MQHAAVPQREGAEEYGQDRELGAGVIEAFSDGPAWERGPSQGSPRWHSTPHAFS